MSEELVVRVNETRFYHDEKPEGWPNGGQFVLTNKRLVFIKGLYGPVDLDWGLKIKGSFMIPVNDIIEAKVEGGGWSHLPFLKLRYRTPDGEEKNCSFIFRSKITLAEAAMLGYLAGLPGILIGSAFGAPSQSKSPYEQVAKAIESLKKAHESSMQK
jgi:hypothetical protein